MVATVNPWTDGLNAPYGMSRSPKKRFFGYWKCSPKSRDCIGGRLWLPRLTTVHTQNLPADVAIARGQTPRISSANRSTGIVRPTRVDFLKG